MRWDFRFWEWLRCLSGGIGKLAGRVHPAFAFLFTLLIYLSIGPCLAIPRTSSTSFEMTVFPVLKQLGVSFTSTVRGTGFTVQTMAQFGYSVVFFTAAWQWHSGRIS